MNKYQRVMEHVKVDDEMKKRILQNLEKEMAAEPKVVQFGRSAIRQIKRHSGMAAMFAILLLGAFAVVRITGDISNTSAPSMSDTAMEAPAAEEAMEAPAATESAYEEAAEPVEAPATEEAMETTGSAKTEEDAPKPVGDAQPTAAHYVGPIVLLIIVIAVIALIIWLIIYLIRKFRSRK